MKRILFVLLIVVLLGGCGGDRYPIEKDYGFSRTFYVSNQTDRDIVVMSNYRSPLKEPYEIAPDESEWITGNSEMGGENTIAKLEDDLDDNYRIKHYAMEVRYYKMLVDGKEVSDEIWLRKHWSFESDFYNRTYTLYVTDELLEQLGWKE